MVPEFANDCSIDVSFCPPVGCNASAASVYDDDPVLCSIVGDDDTKIEEVAVRKVETTECCSEHAGEGS